VSGDVTTEEVSAERGMLELGVERYRSGMQKATEKGRYSATQPGRFLLREAVGRMEDAIRAWILRATAVPGRLHGCTTAVNMVPPDVLALLVSKVAIDHLLVTKKYGTLAGEVARRVEDEAKFRALGDQNPVWLERLKRVCRRSGYAHIRRTLQHYLLQSETAHELWPWKTKHQVGMLLLELLVDSTGMFDVDTRFTASRGRRRRERYIMPSRDLLEWLDRSNEIHEEMAPYWLPMLSVPGDWECMRGGGYHLPELQRGLVKAHTRRHRGELEAADLGDVLPAVNHLQKCVWDVNEDVWRTVQHFWDVGEEMSCLPPRDDPPIPPKPADIDDNPEARKDWRRDAGEAYDKRISFRSSRLHVARVLQVAAKYVGRDFHFPYQACFRGRVYPVPYHLQPQGPDVVRGLLRFRRGRVVPAGSDGARWLAIHGANVAGHDKGTFDERVAWVEENHDNVMAVGRDPVDCRWWEDQDKPWSFLAFCLEWHTLQEEGAVLSRIPVFVDGSNNGLQLFSLLLRDPVGAAATNVAPTDRPADIYQEVADLVTVELGRRAGVAGAAAGHAGSLVDTTAPYAKDAKMSVRQVSLEWLRFCGGSVPRKCSKRPVMTLPYGSTLYSCQKYVREWFDAECVKPGKSNPFGRAVFKPCSYLAGVLWDAIATKVGKAQACMRWMQEAADVFSEHNLGLRWTSPSGFPVYQWYPKWRTESISTCIGEKVRWSSRRKGTDNVDPVRQRNGVSPNFIHSLDAACLAQAVVRARDRGIADVAVVHDSFGAHADQIGQFRDVLREVYSDVFSENVLQRFADELRLYLPHGAVIPDPPDLGDFDVRSVVRSDYLFS
jgi:DNA-directed RNA polymerase, mitochondrial